MVGDRIWYLILHERGITSISPNIAHMNDTTAGSRLAVIGLPTDQTFIQLLIPYFSPYALYVAIEALPAAWLSPEVKQILKLVAVSAALVWFFKWYQFGKLAKKHLLISIAAAPIAILLWVVPLYFIKSPEQARNSSPPYM
jgi:hypothetical protein